jgi:hypothetical protein
VCVALDEDKAFPCNASNDMSGCLGVTGPFIPEQSVMNSASPLEELVSKNQYAS